MFQIQTLHYNFMRFRDGYHLLSQGFSANVNDDSQWLNCHNACGPSWWEVKVTVRLCGGCVYLWERAGLFMGSKNDWALFWYHVWMIDAATHVLKQAYFLGRPCLHHRDREPLIFCVCVCVCVCVCECSVSLSLIKLYSRFLSYIFALSYQVPH